VPQKTHIKKFLTKKKIIACKKENSMLLSNTALKFLSVASVTTQLTTAATTTQKNIQFL
jgi:hypothetical protein